jgi:hypothetical protein
LAQELGLDGSGETSKGGTLASSESGLATELGSALSELSTQDFLEAIRAPRPSLNDDALGAFDRESRIHQRL